MCDSRCMLLQHEPPSFFSSARHNSGQSELMTSFLRRGWALIQGHRLCVPDGSVFVRQLLTNELASRYGVDIPKTVSDPSEGDPVEPEMLKRTAPDKIPRKSIPGILFHLFADCSTPPTHHAQESGESRVLNAIITKSQSTPYAPHDPKIKTADA